jgi:2-phosphoglycerate kinase
MPDVILLSGVSGVGKTHLRENSYLSEYPYVDIADIYTEWPEVGWFDATNKLIDKVHKLLSRSDTDTVVIEGYFLPGTQSREVLSLGLYADFGTDLGAQEIFLHASKELCVQRIKQSEHDVECRLELLDKRWEYANRVHRNGGA